MKKRYYNRKISASSSAASEPATPLDPSTEAAIGADSNNASEPIASDSASASDSSSDSSAATAETLSVDDNATVDTHRRKRRRNRSGYEHAEDSPMEPADEPIGGDDPYAVYKAYGEPLSEGEQGDDFDELKAMEELLANSGECGALPLPEVFNAYPPEVQRKIMEWADRDVKARRDDESRRKDELVRASIERERRRQSLPAIIIIVAVLCGAILGFVTKNPVFCVMFLVVPIAVIVAVFVSRDTSGRRSERYRMPPK